MFEATTTHRLAMLRYREMLAETEGQRQLRSAAYLDAQAVRKPPVLATFFGALRKRFKAQFSN